MRYENDRYKKIDIGRYSYTITKKFYIKKLSFDITVVELSFMSYTSTGNRNMLQ
jgi:hypothetical protein